MAGSLSLECLKRDLGPRVLKDQIEKHIHEPSKYVEEAIFAHLPTKPMHKERAFDRAVGQGDFGSGKAWC